MVSRFRRVLWALCCHAASVAGYRDGALDPPFHEATPFSPQSSLQLHSGGAMIKSKRRSGVADGHSHGHEEEPFSAHSSMLETHANRSLHSFYAGPAPPDEDAAEAEGGETSQGLKDEDCTVELVPHARLMEFRTQLKDYLTTMVTEFVDKVEKQKVDHSAEKERIEQEMSEKTKKTKTELVRMIRGFTIEQQRAMVITRHDVSGMCCCDTQLDTNKDGTLSKDEIRTYLDQKQTGVCEWIPKGCQGPLRLEGLKGNLCPALKRWEYRNIVGSGARISSKEVDRIVDDCIDSEEWYKFVAGKKPFQALNDARRKKG